MFKELKKQIESFKPIFKVMVNNCKSEYQKDFAIRKYEKDLDRIIEKIENFEKLHTETAEPKTVTFR